MRAEGGEVSFVEDGEVGGGEEIGALVEHEQLELGKCRGEGICRSR